MLNLKLRTKEYYNKEAVYLIYYIQKDVFYKQEERSADEN